MLVLRGLKFLFNCFAPVCNNEDCWKLLIATQNLQNWMFVLLSPDHGTYGRWNLEICAHVRSNLSYFILLGEAAKKSSFRDQASKALLFLNKSHIFAKYCNKPAKHNDSANSIHSGSDIIVIWKIFKKKFFFLGDTAFPPPPPSLLVAGPLKKVFLWLP